MWFRIDDQSAFHSKMVKAGNEAVGAWARMGAWTSGALKSGFVPEAMALLIAGSQATIDRLVGCGDDGHSGLLEPAPGGYALHDFHDWNMSAEEVEAERIHRKAQRSQAGKRSAEKRKKQRETQRQVNEPLNSRCERPQRDVNETSTGGQRESNPVPVPVPSLDSHTQPAAPTDPDADAMVAEFNLRADLFDGADLATEAARLLRIVRSEPKADDFDRRQIATELVADVVAYSAKYKGADVDQRVGQMSRKLALILGDIRRGTRTAGGRPSGSFERFDRASATDRTADSLPDYSKVIPKRAS